MSERASFESAGIHVCTQPAEMRRTIRALQATGKRVGVVPTMGALHEGHLSLARASSAACDVTIATIFVNPTQFGPNEDFTRYPRTFDNDLKLLASEGVEHVFAPTTDAMYPAGFSTFVEPPAVSRRLEGESRPGHFRGVCTVVLKLFEAVPADAAFFGQKDFQQALVIEHMTRDLNLAPTIEVCPIIRDEDGLALSSRNRYLSPSERQKALAISKSLRDACAAAEAGERDAETLRRQIRSTLQAAPVDQIEYVSIADGNTLEELAAVSITAVALIAVKVGTTRLIDNAWLLPAPSRTVKD